MAGLAEIRAALVSIVEGITIPADDPLPSIPFREASYETSLSALPTKARAKDTTRSFHVLADPVLEGNPPSTCFVVQHELLVQVRYDLKIWNQRDYAARLTTVAYSDQARICKAALRAPTSIRWPAHMETVSFSAADPVVEGQSNRIWTATTRLLVEYRLGD